MSIVRLYVRDGMLLSEARELFADLEHAHDTVVAVDLLASSLRDRLRRVSRQYLEEFEPFALLWPEGWRAPGFDLIRTDPSQLLLPRQRMSLVRAELSSPGSFDIGGAGRGVDAVTNALRYRQERREGRIYRDKDRQAISEAEARGAHAQADEQEEHAEQARIETDRARRTAVLEEIAFRGHIRDAVQNRLLSRDEAAPLLNASVEALQQLQRGVAGELVERAELQNSDDPETR